MTEKQTYALNKVITALPDNCRKAFREVAEHAISLGYMPIIKGAHETYADFTKSKIKRTILKIDTDPKFPPRLAIKFFALPMYSGLFYEGIEGRVNLLRQMGYESRCWGCGKCDSTQGYTYELSDGRKGFLCGKELIPLPSFHAKNVSEVKSALKVQDDFFMNKAGTQ